MHIAVLPAKIQQMEHPCLAPGGQERALTIDCCGASCFLGDLIGARPYETPNAGQ